MKKQNRSTIIQSLKEHMAVGSVAIALLLLCAIWALITPYFLTMANLRSLGIYIASTGIMAAGLTVTLLTGAIDLSQIPLMALCGMVVGIANQSGVHGFALVLIAIVMGTLGGLVNAFTTCILGIIPFIATLGSQLVFRAIAYIATDGVYLSISDNLISAMTRIDFLGLPVMVWIMVAVYVVVWFILKYTQYGRNLFSVGGSPTAAYLSGINVKRTQFIAYMVSGACCGLASILYVAQANVALNNAGSGSEMDIMTAAILGGISLAGGQGSVVNTLLGVLLLGVIANGMSLLSITPYYQMLIKGIILLAAVYLDILRNKKK